MNRLTTDKPNDNTSHALNMFYAKGGKAWVRTLDMVMPRAFSGDATLNDFIRKLWSKYDGGEFADLPDDDLELADFMDNHIYDGPDDICGLLAMLYRAGWVAAELRAYLKVYEDTAVPIVIPDDLETFKEAVKTYGPEAQTDMMIEEMSELTKAILKLRRTRSHPGPAVAECLDHISEEMADVYIMLVQLLDIYDNAKEVEFCMRQKAARLRLRLHPEEAVKV